jgi:2-methylisocitrate lyase-like PEP mutase family enzyme
MNLSDKAARLRTLLHADDLLVLPNSWDVASARVLAGAGFEAIATASHAVSAALGYADGEEAPADEMFAAAARIARGVDVPVSVDAESGYGLAPDELAARLRDAGAAGFNLEDTLHSARRAGPGRPLADVAEQAKRISAIRDACGDLVINARTDVFIHGVLPEASDEERLEEAVTRGRAYLEAGADSIFMILVRDEPTIAALVERVPGPINILYQAGGPSLARLGELGVARVTFGPRLHGATLALLGDLATQIRSGTDPLL